MRDFSLYVCHTGPVGKHEKFQSPDKKEMTNHPRNLEHKQSGKSTRGKFKRIQNIRNLILHNFRCVLKAEAHTLSSS